MVDMMIKSAPLEPADHPFLKRIYEHCQQINDKTEKIRDAEPSWEECATGDGLDRGHETFWNILVPLFSDIYFNAMLENLRLRRNLSHSIFFVIQDHNAVHHLTIT